MVKRDRVFQAIDHVILFLVAAFCVQIGRAHV